MRPEAADGSCGLTKAWRGKINRPTGHQLFRQATGPPLLPSIEPEFRSNGFVQSIPSTLLGGDEGTRCTRNKSCPLRLATQRPFFVLVLKGHYLLVATIRQLQEYYSQGA